MSLDKAISRGKEHRKPYYRKGRFCNACRPHGGCERCADDRLYRDHRLRAAADDQINEWLKGNQEWREYATHSDQQIYSQ